MLERCAQDPARHGARHHQGRAVSTAPAPALAFARSTTASRRQRGQPWSPPLNRRRPLRAPPQYGARGCRGRGAVPAPSGRQAVPRAPCGRPTAATTPASERGTRDVLVRALHGTAALGRGRNARGRRTVRPQPVREAWSTGAEVAGGRGRRAVRPPKPPPCPNAVHIDVFESLVGSECETLTSCG